MRHRKGKLREQLKTEILEKIAQGFSNRQIMKLMDLPHATYYRMYEAAVKTLEAIEYKNKLGLVLKILERFEWRRQRVQLALTKAKSQKEKEFYERLLHEIDKDYAEFLLKFGLILKEPDKHEMKVQFVIKDEGSDKESTSQ